MKLKVSVGEAASARATPMPVCRLSGCMVVYRKCQLECCCHHFWSSREGGSLNRNEHNSWHTDSSFIHPSIHLWGSSSSVCCMFYGCLSVYLSFMHSVMAYYKRHFSQDWNPTRPASYLSTTTSANKFKFVKVHFSFVLFIFIKKKIKKLQENDKKPNLFQQQISLASKSSVRTTAECGEPEYLSF